MLVSNVDVTNRPTSAAAAIYSFWRFKMASDFLRSVISCADATNARGISSTDLRIPTVIQVGKVESS